MKISHFLPALALLAASSAFASDLPSRKTAPPAPAFTAYSWTGVYAGLDAGYLWGQSSVTRMDNGATQRLRPGAFTLGAHLGYRYQFANNIVAGVEVRGFANLDSKATGPGADLAVYYSYIKQEFGGDARLTLGYAFNRFMIYAAGGLAVADLKGCYAVDINGACQTADGPTRYSTTRVGWTVGGGAAYALTNNVQVRLDYAYSRFPTFKNTMEFDSGTKDMHLKYQTHAVRGGVSYKF